MASNFSPLTCYSYKRDKNNGNLYYPFGNSTPEDLFLQQPNSSNLSALLLGCGDLRNVLYTLTEAKRKDAQSINNRFFMNDWQPDIIARNIVICHALICDASLTANILSQFWYSLEMSQVAYDYWMAKTQECILMDWENHEFISVFDSGTLKELKNIWHAWLIFGWSKSDVLTKRNLFLKKYLTDSNTDRAENFINSIDPDNRASSAMKAKWAQECIDIYNSGSLDARLCLNPSLHFVDSAGKFYYGLHYTSNPFEGHRCDINLSLKKNLMKNLTEWIEVAHVSKLRLTFATGHALHFIDRLIEQNDTRFDLIETSNLIDHIGMLTIILNGSILLKEKEGNNYSILKTCSFHMHGYESSRTKYLEKVTGLPLNTFATLIGVQVDLFSHENWQSDVSASSKSFQWGRNHEYFVFRKSNRPVAPISLKKSPYLLQCLVECAETIMRPYEQNEGIWSMCVNPSLFCKALALGFAQQRITYEPCTFNVLPFQDPLKLWATLLDSKFLGGTMADLFLHGNLYGFPMKAHHETHGNPLLVKQTFKAVTCNETPTPILFIMVEEAIGVTHTIQSSHHIDRQDGQTEFTFYLPAFLKKEIPTLKIYVMAAFCKVIHMIMPACLPIPLSGAHITQMGDFALKKIILGAMLELNKKTILPINHIVENFETFEVEIGLPKNYEGKLTIKDADTLFVGLMIDGRFMEIQLPCNVILVHCKIHRKSRYISLSLKKMPSIFYGPIISVSGLKPIIPEFFPPITLGLMYDGDYFDVKSGKNDPESLPGMKQILFGLKDNVQIFFVKALKFKGCMLHTPNSGIIGCVLFHGIFEHQSIDSSTTSFPILDASYAFFQPEHFQMAMALRGQFPESNLVMNSGELKAMMELFRMFQHCSKIKTQHPDCPGNIFKRCVIYPIYSKENPHSNLNPGASERIERAKKMAAEVKKLKLNSNVMANVFQTLSMFS